MGTQSNGSGVTDGEGWPSQTVFHAQPINNKMRGLKQKCHFFSNSSQQKLSTPPRESFKKILEEILEGNLGCGSAQPSLFLSVCVYVRWSVCVNHKGVQFTQAILSVD